MIRLRLGIEDLARTTFAAPTPYCELPVSAQALQQPASQFRRLWRRGQAGFPAPARRLLELVPAYGSVPAFLSPETRDGLDDALDAVLSTPTSLIRSELESLPSSSGISPWMRDLARGHIDALAELGSVMRSYHDGVMAPLWPMIERVVASELRGRAWQLATEGAEVTLNTLHPWIRWRDGTLEVHAPGDADIDLAGRGLRLMPSTWTRPAVAISWEQPTLVYPLRLASWVQEDDAAAEAQDRLATVLGTTRARVLRTLGSEHTTTELARALNISPASASTQAAALRNAGLVTTRRDGKSVRHTLTDLGRAVVAAAPDGPRPQAQRRPGYSSRSVTRTIAL
ncbi:MAG TPA: helix-turn-helix domain-containing protein [Actinomycetes bacterium]|nr:helix-turn-helix domain-containing protein [Actinomycetes bacterium]